MSVLIQPNSSRSKAFRRGFLKGLGAPIVLFGTFDLVNSANADFAPVPLPKRSRGSLSDDWKAVGRELTGASKLG